MLYFYNMPKNASERLLSARKVCYTSKIKVFINSFTGGSNERMA
jgi:hypothetical protein